MKVNFSVILIGIVLATRTLSKNLDLSEITRIRNEISQYTQKPGNVERKLAVVSMNQSSSPALNSRPVDRYLKPTKTPRELLNLDDQKTPLTQQPLKTIKKEGRILAQSASVPAPRMLKDKTSKADKIIVTYVPAKPKASKKLTSFMQKSSDRKLKLKEPNISKENKKAPQAKKTKKAKKSQKISKAKGRHLQDTPQPRKLFDYQNAYPQKRFQNTYFRNYDGRGYRV